MRKLKSGYTLAGLPDKDDEHVVALARQENIKLILTFNLDDFPEKILAAYQIKHVIQISFSPNCFTRA